MIASFLTACTAVLAEAVDAIDSVPVAEDPGSPLFVAVALLLLALGLAAVEFVVVSGGMLGLGAIICALASVAYAFADGPLAGWVFTALVPILGILVLKSGMSWLRRSPLVTQSEITSDAGYHHAFADQGLVKGSRGVLVTPAMPSGRARFAGATGPIEVDVQIRGGAGETGDAVTILAIEGPVVTCTLAPTPSAPSPSLQP